MKTLTAPMGWNSFDCYGAAVDEATVRKNAEFMAKHLKKYGWEYVVVDIQWSSPNVTNHEYIPFDNLCMDEFSRLIPAENRFPSSADGKGFAPLAEYVPSLGLKFGIHIMRGIPRQAVHNGTKIKNSDKTARDIAKTSSICEWNTDMYGVDPEKDGAKAYYDSIFELYASWGVDFIKCDDIARELPHEETELLMLSDSLHNCGRDMVLSLSPGPAILEKAELYKQVADMWRITDDFWDKWELLYNMFERAEKWCIHSAAGHWPDCDMLPLGRIGKHFGQERSTNFTPDEQKTMMTLWCIFGSPLMLGAEMTKLDEWTLSLLCNEELLRLESGRFRAKQVLRDDKVCVWAALDVSGGEYYVALFNLSEEERRVEVTLEECGAMFPEGRMELQPLHEVWSGRTFTAEDGVLGGDVKPHGVLLLHKR